MGRLSLLVIISAVSLCSLGQDGGLSDPGSTVPSKGRSYGEPCTCDSDCDFSQWLNCHNGSCICLSRTFQYDYERLSCVVRLGEKCFEVAADYVQYKELPPFIRCVQGAFCSISAGGLCACNTYGFFESSGPDGLQCDRKKPFGATCQHSVECKSDACTLPEGKCSCKEGQYYDRSQDRCVGLVGSYCFTDDECTENSICNGLQGAKCSCVKGFSSTETLTCAKQLKYGDNCNATTPCNSASLGCFKGQCECRYPLHQIYDPDSEKCRTVVGTAPCAEDDSCVLHARCQNVQSTSECQCVPGFVEMGDGSCARFNTFGETCEKDEECDPVTPLVCKDSICQCRDSLTLFDHQRRLCRGLHGFRGCQNKDEFCVQNAHCVQYNPTIPPKCQCRPPSYSPNANRTCQLGSNSIYSNGNGINSVHL